MYNFAYEVYWIQFKPD